MEEKTVLICPLDWGIGHATRCVPVIRKFMEAGFHVVIAADGRPLSFLKREFPNCDFITFRGVKVTYSRSRWLLLKLCILSPRLLYGIFREHRDLRRILRETRAGIVVSDNRYGLWNRSVRTVFITHQINIQLPENIKFLQGFVNKVLLSFIRRFDECWIADFEMHQGLAGKLTHPLPSSLSNAYYIGTLSRFYNEKNQPDVSGPPQFELLVLLSGPEPQRTILEEKILSSLEESAFHSIVISGKTEEISEYVINERIWVFSHLETSRMKKVLKESGMVICRSGYSSIMDLVTVGKRAVLIPTPGQPEQEYLAHYLLEKKIFFSVPQKDFDLLYAIEMSKNYPGMVLRNDLKVLEERIRFFLPSSS
ncbi:MAG: glycosyltransferase [Bacteroidota bacterium]|nr:glycosyltransferase [Bacteroidota bacterium]